MTAPQMFRRRAHVGYGHLYEADGRPSGARQFGGSFAHAAETVRWTQHVFGGLHVAGSQGKQFVGAGDPAVRPVRFYLTKSSLKPVGGRSRAGPNLTSVICITSDNVYYVKLNMVAHGRRPIPAISQIAIPSGMMLRVNSPQSFSGNMGINLSCGDVGAAKPPAAQKSAPCSRRWVAKACRIVCGETFF